MPRRVGAGSIIKISAIEGIIDVSAYNASKGGVRIFTKSVALDCAGLRHPGEFSAPRLCGAPPGGKRHRHAAGGPASALQEDLIGRIPLGRRGAPREIASTMLVLRSDQSSYMTGSELLVDGGYTAS